MTPTGAAATRVIVLHEPAGPEALITTRDLVVRGHLSAGTGPVQVVLESSGGKPIAVRTVGPMTLGRWTDDPTPAFSVSFPLSNPRPGGVMTVQVAAYDLEGIPIDVVRRRVRIGAIAPRVLGDDGLMGGIVFGTDRP